MSAYQILCFVLLAVFVLSVDSFDIYDQRTGANHSLLLDFVVIFNIFLFCQLHQKFHAFFL